MGKGINYRLKKAFAETLKSPLTPGLIGFTFIALTRDDVSKNKAVFYTLLLFTVGNVLIANAGKNIATNIEKVMKDTSASIDPDVIG